MVRLTCSCRAERQLKTFKVEGGTGGPVTVFENVLRPQARGPARHVHRRWTEFFDVLEGEMVFELDGQGRAAPAGTFVFVPPGTVHAFRNPTDESPKLLISFIRGSFEGFFDAGKDLGSPMTDAAAWQTITVGADPQIA